MDYGIALATTTASWRTVQRAEALGFDAAWFYDTQLLNPDVFVGMALAAHETERIRLGTGVLIPSNRIAPVAANGFASLNALAPGRIDFGVGTGFTGRRTMGLGAIKLDALRDYVRNVQGLLRGDTVAPRLEGAPRKMRFLNPDLRLINLEDPVPLHVSAMGPRSRRLTAELGGGWLNFGGDPDGAVRDLADMQAAWQGAGQAQSLDATLFTLGCVLGEDEPADSERAVAQAGPYVAVVLHNLVETSKAGALEGRLPAPVVEAVERFRPIHDGYRPGDERHLVNHRGHLMFLRPEERPLITGALIRALTFTGTEAELRRKLERLETAGYTQVAVQLVEGHEDALADWARVFGLGS